MSIKIQNNSTIHSEFNKIMATYTSITTTTTTTASMCSNTAVRQDVPIQSPEKLAGCIFTRFFRVNSPNCNQTCPPSVSLAVSSLNFMKKSHATQMDSLESGWPIGRRKVSETDSEDSFIVFEEFSPCRSKATVRDSYNFRRPSQVSDCSDVDFLRIENGTNDTLLDCDDATDDDTDLTDTSVNDTEYSSADETDTETTGLPHLKNEQSNGKSTESKKCKVKRVRFDLRPIVHVMRAWKFAYAQARKGHWQQIGWDHQRFGRRINELSRLLSPILATDHRQMICMRNNLSEN